MSPPSQAAARRRRVRLWAALLTLILVGVAYGVLAMWVVPRPRFDREVFERIDWVRFVPKMQPQSIGADETTEEEASKDAEPEPPAPRLERIDIRGVMEKLRIGQPTPDQATELPQLGAADKPSGVLKIDPDDVERISGLKLLMHDLGPPLNLPEVPQPGSRPGGGAGRPTLEGGTGLEVRQQKLGEGGGTLAGPGGKDLGSGPAVEIALKELSSFGSNYEDFTPIYKALVEWMRRHPSVFPPAVKRLMTQEGWDPAFLTSEVSFVVGQRRFRMFLMCKEELYEVHICLLEGAKSTYLIDRGFQERSNYLRIGEVKLAEDGRVLSFGTQRQASSDIRTREFYQIFLSWWDTVKDEVDDSP